MRKTKVFKKVMIFWTLFIGIGAVAGATGMLVAPDGSAIGMKGMLPFFQVLPFADILFQNFIFPGISLLVVNGLTNLTAFFLIIQNKKAGAYLGCTFGFTLMLWICIQFVIFPMNFMSTIYFFFGLAQFICGLLFIIFSKQSHFVFDATSYKNIGTKPETLVVFFSRLGYTKKVAYETANELGAKLYEITTPEKTEGFFGFAWLGRFGMHRWGMPIDAVDIDLTIYEKVVIVSPVHVFKVASPTREFCKQCAGKIKQVEYILVHFRKDSRFPGAFDEMDALLGVKADKRESVVCKFGNVIKREVVK